MKKNSFIFYGIIAILFTSCFSESLEENTLTNLDIQTSIQSNIDLDNLGEECISVNLIAGQHDIAGSVKVYNDGENLIIVYTTNDDWTLDLTHLSIGNCDEDWVPLTGSGNPKIGRFEFTEPYSISDHEIVYVISLEGLDDAYCFAAHAEVEGPNGGETAWAEGTEFSGNSWAMFVEGLLSKCTEDVGTPT